MNVEAEEVEPTPKVRAPQRERAKQITDKALLKVKVYSKGNEAKVIGAANVTSSLVGMRQTKMENGIADFNVVPTGKHSIKVVLQGQMAKDYKAPTDPVEVTLKNGDNVTVPIEVEPQAWIGVKVVDEAGQPVKDVKVRIKLTNGSTVDVDFNTAALQADGSYQTEHNIDPGQCEISCPELFDLEWRPQ